MSKKNIRSNNLQKAKMKGDVSMSLFDINAQLISQLPAHDAVQLEEDVLKIDEFDTKTNSNYYMLLCKEASYYTLFTTIGEPEDEKSFGEIVIECATALGEIHSVENIEDNEIELWVVNGENETRCLHLFDYARGVVIYKR